MVMSPPTLRMLRPTLGRTFILKVVVVILFVFCFAYILTTTRFTDDDELGPDFNFGSHSPDEDFHKNEDVVARQLAKEVRVLCWVMTSPGNHDSKARHVKATWGKRCNILLFMSSTNDTKLGTVKLAVSEGRDNLWQKTKLAFKYVHEHHKDDADWFLKADDDTYVIVENLRHMLSAQKSAEPVYFGCRLKQHTKQGYMSGGAGYVLSRRALDMFIQDGLTDPKKCRPGHEGSEDVEMGKCLEAVGVLAGDSRDVLGRGRFFPLTPERHLTPGHEDNDIWYREFIFDSTEEGLECCSDTAVSFHYVSPKQMYVLDYLIYHLHPYGISHQFVDASKELPTDKTSIQVEDKPSEKERVTEKTIANSQQTRIDGS